MYKNIMNLKLAGKEKLQFLLRLKHYQLDANHAVIELPCLDGDRGLICHSSGLVLNFSKHMIKGLSNKFVGELDINNNHYYLYKPINWNTTSKYRWCRLGWTNLYAAEHVFISIAFGLWDNIKYLDGMEVCHKVAVTNDKCDNSVDNLFVDTHRFNMVCARLESALRAAGVESEIPLDRNTFSDWCDKLKMIISLDQMYWLK